MIEKVVEVKEEVMHAEMETVGGGGRVDNV